MSADPQATASDAAKDEAAATAAEAPESSNGAAPTDEQDEDQDDGDDDDDDEPKLKYAKLTGNLTGVYRNGDFTTSTCVAGDKLVMGTQDGNIHVLSLPTMEALRTYHAHSASITSCSVSPIPPPPTMVKTQDGSREFMAAPGMLSRAPTVKSLTTTAKNPKDVRMPQPVVPNTPNNQVYVATSSIDGHVCVSSLVDPKDVQLRNFARPVQAVVLSPEYKTDRSYISGGRAGQLVLTVGGKSGVSSNANTNSSAAGASWLGSIGLGATNGKDTILHQGEGSISTIKWSMSGKWVVWVNEEGIKIMRSHLRLDSEASEDSWRRIAHAAKPNKKSWEDMASVWKARAEWVDERLLESDDLTSATEAEKSMHGGINGTAGKREQKPEKLIVGWGDTAWIMHVHEGGVVAAGRHAGERQVGSADIIHKLQFWDCIVSGVTLYSPSLLAILAYRTRDDDDNPLPSAQSTPKKGRSHRHTSLAPQLRLVKVSNGEEVDLDELSVSRFETLSAQDYQLGTLFMPPAIPEKATREQRGALEGLWEASGGGYATRLFSSGASVLTRSDSESEKSAIPGVSSPRGGSIQGVTPTPSRTRPADAHPYMIEPGLKLFVQSPYDCVLAVKRDLSDHLEWLLEHQQYHQAWQLLDKRPDILDGSDRNAGPSAPVDTPSQAQKGSLADFFADTDSQTTASASRSRDTAAAREKRRIGDLWLSQLIAADRWQEAGKVAGTVLEKSGRWEHWVFTFAQADKFDEITPFIPSTMLKPPLPSEVYEIILGHYIMVNPTQVVALLDSWDPDLFDLKSIITAIESRLRSGEVTEMMVHEGIQGRDWRILLEALAKLYLVNGQTRDALHCYIRTQNAEAAMNLIRDEKVTEAIADDIPGFITLRVSKQQLRSAEISELEETSSEAISLLAEEGLRGSIPTMTVVQQLQQKGGSMQIFLFFYFRALWQGGSATSQNQHRKPTRMFERNVNEGHMMVEDHADLAVSLFAEYDRNLLLDFLQSSEVYNYDRAVTICDQRHYIPELVHVLAKTGQLKRALWLIIGELGDVVKAIGFVKENPDLWDDLLEYGMNKPDFIRGLLEEVGTAVDPVELVRRIPVGLEIAGLKQGIMRLVKEYEIQYSISEGVARVLRGEVAMGMDTLRAGQRKAVRFEVVHDHDPDHVDLAVHDVPTKVEGGALPVTKRKVQPRNSDADPGHCVGCSDTFHEDEMAPLLGFACGHVYHLGCLLRANPATADDKTVADLLSQLGYGDDEDDDNAEAQAYTGRSVGAKVAHAHVIKNVVQGGCKCCVIPEGA